MNYIIKSLLPKKSLEFLKCLTYKDLVIRIYIFRIALGVYEIVKYPMILTKFVVKIIC